MNIVVKRHPRERNSSLSSEIGRKNIYTYKGDLSESAKNAELVVFTGTTSGLETLLLCKKVIQLGNHSALPVINNEGLVHIVSKMKEDIVALKLQKGDLRGKAMKQLLGKDYGKVYPSKK